MNRTTPLLAASAMAFSLFVAPLSANTLTLYTDPTTGALYATPSPSRTAMGTFVSVDEKPKWYDKLKINGYMQFRNTAWLEREPNDFKGYWADKSTSPGSNFFIRRARLIISGEVGPHLRIYIQPDFASSAGSTNHMGQLRDFYGDVYFDSKREHRIRVGQSKVPYGFENMQSSSKRLTLDRNDALNSAVRDERDIGSFYYYTPVHVQKLFDQIDDMGLKSSGNYGMFALGAYNGQGANRSEANENNHIVTRLTYPFKTSSGQIFEFGVQGYTGLYKSPNVDSSNKNAYDITDERVGFTAIMYQQPFGLQTEWNWGTTPGADTSDMNTTFSAKNLFGGYIQAMYRLTDALKIKDALTLFAKWQYFDGYSKAEKNSPYNQVNDWEIGFEWQAAKEVEFAAVWHIMNRSDIQQENGYGERFTGSALRFQMQVNY